MERAVKKRGREGIGALIFLDTPFLNSGTLKNATPVPTFLDVPLTHTAPVTFTL